jgi:hypothetical protein
MTDTVTLKLTQAEAYALHELVEKSAEKFFMVVGGDKDYEIVGWTENDAAMACDKLRAAALGIPLDDEGWRNILTLRIK